MLVQTLMLLFITTAANAQRDGITSCSQLNTSRKACEGSGLSCVWKEYEDTGRTSCMPRSDRAGREAKHAAEKSMITGGGLDKCVEMSRSNGDFQNCVDGVVGDDLRNTGGGRPDGMKNSSFGKMNAGRVARSLIPLSLTTATAMVALENKCFTNPANIAMALAGAAVAFAEIGYVNKMCKIRNELSDGVASIIEQKGAIKTEDAIGSIEKYYADQAKFYKTKQLAYYGAVTGYSVAATLAALELAFGAKLGVKNCFRAQDQETSTPQSEQTTTVTSLDKVKDPSKFRKFLKKALKASMWGAPGALAAISAFKQCKVKNLTDEEKIAHGGKAAIWGGAITTAQIGMKKVLNSSKSIGLMFVSFAASLNSVKVAHDLGKRSKLAREYSEKLKTMREKASSYLSQQCDHDSAKIKGAGGVEKDNPCYCITPDFQCNLINRDKVAFCKQHPACIPPPELRGPSFVEATQTDQFTCSSRDKKGDVQFLSCDKCLGKKDQGDDIKCFKYAVPRNINSPGLNNPTIANMAKSVLGSNQLGGANLAARPGDAFGALKVMSKAKAKALAKRPDLKKQVEVTEAALNRALQESLPRLAKTLANAPSQNQKPPAVTKAQKVARKKEAKEKKKKIKYSSAKKKKAKGAKKGASADDFFDIGDEDSLSSEEELVVMNEDLKVNVDDVVKRPETSIFKIISSRVMKSGLPRLFDEDQK